MSTLRVVACVRTASFVRLLQRAVGAMEQAELVLAKPPARVREVMESALFSLAVVDLSLDGSTELLRDIRTRFPEVSILVITDPGLRDHDRTAMKIGVDGFLVQPLRAEHVAFQIAHVREVRFLREEHQRQIEEIRNVTALGDIVGGSDVMRQVFHLVSRAAASSVPVALYGESGTGKERVARAIHRESMRGKEPFIAVNPSAIPDSLIESELFGHVQGAFTGAAGDRIGYIEAANGGTLFLDEIGDLPKHVQVKLLRVLQERSLQRVGSTRGVRVDFRLISATHRDLNAEVQAGRFREDLFYRIHVFPIYLPALRSRRSDIPALAEHFLRRYVEEMDRPLVSFAPGVLEALTLHSWPGNVRELENVIYRIVAMKRPGEAIELGDLVGLVESTPSVVRSGGGMPARIASLADHMTEYVRWVHDQVDGNKAKAARLLGIDRGTLYRRLAGPSSRR